MQSRPGTLCAGALLGLVLLTGSASAGAWKIAPTESQVLFEYESGGEPRVGRFTRFEGEGRFDPDNPEVATLEVRIESSSIDLDNRLASDFAKTPEYFSSRNFPHVIYRLQKLTPETDGQYRAEGELTIRQWTRPVESAIRLEIEGETARAEGSLKVLREDFHFGVGPSSIFVDLGPVISVRFELTAHPAP